MRSEIFITFFIFTCFYLVIRTLSNNQVRKKVIERGLEGDQIKEVFGEMNDTVRFRLSPLKFGLIFIMMGISLVVVEMAELYDEYAVAVFFLSVGLVLTIFPFLEKKIKELEK